MGVFEEISYENKKTPVQMHRSLMQLLLENIDLCDPKQTTLNL